jgi:hypothetical protein
LPILDSHQKAEAAHNRAHGQTWTDYAADIWAKPETKEIVGVAATVGAVALGIRFGGISFTRGLASAEKNVAGLLDAVPGVIERAAPEVADLAPSLLEKSAPGLAGHTVPGLGEHSVPGLVERANAHLTGGDLGMVKMMPRNSVLGADHPVPVAANSNGPTIESIAKPAVLRTDKEQIGSVMDKPENVIKLTDRLHADVASWPDFVPLQRRAGVAADRLEKTYERLGTKLSAKGFDLDLVNLSAQQLAHLKEMPGLGSSARDLQTLVTRRDELNASYGVYNSEVENAGRVWTRTINRFSRTHGLPSARVEFKSDDINFGTYLDRTLNIDRDLLIEQPTGIKAVQTGVHEYTHHEQQFLEISCLADRMNLGRAASSDEVAAIQYYMHDRVSAKTVTRFLDIRNGRSLNSEAELRAERLLDSQIRFRSVMHESAIKDHISTYDWFAEQTTKDVIASLYGPDSARLAAHLAADSADSPLAQRVLNDFAKANARLDKPWSDAYLRRVRTSLNDYIDRGRMLMDDRMRAFKHAYSASYHEQEASANDALALEHLLRR